MHYILKPFQTSRSPRNTASLFSSIHSQIPIACFHRIYCDQVVVFSLRCILILCVGVVDTFTWDIIIPQSILLNAWEHTINIDVRCTHEMKKTNVLQIFISIWYKTVIYSCLLADLMRSWIHCSDHVAVFQTYVCTARFFPYDSSQRQATNFFSPYFMLNNKESILSDSRISAGKRPPSCCHSRCVVWQCICQMPLCPCVASLFVFCVVQLIYQYWFPAKWKEVIRIDESWSIAADFRYRFLWSTLFHAWICLSPSFAVEIDLNGSPMTTHQWW